MAPTAVSSPASPMASADPSEDLLPGGLLDDPGRRMAAIGAVLVVALGLAAYGAVTTFTPAMAAMWIAAGVGVPLGLVALRPRGNLVLVVALVALVVPLGIRTSNLVERPGPPAEASHDGAVFVTRAAGEEILAGRNPYRSRYADDLPESWQVLHVIPGEETPNPVIDHFPYLPGAALVTVPGVLLERVIGIGGDPRWVMGLMLVAAMAALARRPEPAWARGAAMTAFGSAFVVIYAAWGTNDAAAAALVVLAMAAARDRPGWAGVALALAVSYKAPLALALVPWAVWVVDRGGWAALRRWWSFPATLAATCLPFLLWSPSAMVEDTVAFWAGAGDTAFPTSGLGLPVHAPGLMEGVAGPVITAALLVAGLASATVVVRRFDHVAVLPVASALVLLGLFIPARTFQPNYLGLITGLLATGWLVAAGREEPAG